MTLMTLLKKQNKSKKMTLEMKIYQSRSRRGKKYLQTKIIILLQKLILIYNNKQNIYMVCLIVVVIVLKCLLRKLFEIAATKRVSFDIIICAMYSDDGNLDGKCVLNIPSVRFRVFLFTKLKLHFCT